MLTKRSTAGSAQQHLFSEAERLAKSRLKDAAYQSKVCKISEHKAPTVRRVNLSRYTVRPGT
jgi:ribosomal protein S14